MSETNSKEYLLIVGERLKGARISRNITQKQAAEAVGVTQSFLSAVECGKKTACTAQIISLIRYYKVPYETIFGSAESSHDLNEFPDCLDISQCTQLLHELMGGKSSVLEDGAENCLKLCTYMMLRTVYRKNPRNSEKIFKTDYDSAMKKAGGIISNTPEDFSLYIDNGKDIDVKDFEIPVEDSAKLRKFVQECEQMLCSDKDSSDKS